jgi:hypothetical protein
VLLGVEDDASGKVLRRESQALCKRSAKTLADLLSSHMQCFDA